MFKRRSDFAVLSLMIIMVGCGKPGDGGSSTDPVAVNQTGNNTGNNAGGGTDPQPTPVPGGSQAECTEYSSSPNDDRALAEITKMSQQQCKDSLFQLRAFYEATKNMSVEERKNYFAQMTQGMNPPPPPPPEMCSKIYEAIVICAGEK